MIQRRAEYECQAFPDGTWAVRLIHEGGQRSTFIGSGRIPRECRAMGQSGLEAAEEWAKGRVSEHKAEQAEQARLIDGAVTFTVKA